MADEQMGGGLIQTLKIILDKAAAAKVEQDAKDAGRKSGTAFKRGSEAALNQLTTLAKRVAASVAAAFAVRAVYNFGRESVRAAIESRAAWGSLSASLATLGMRLSDVQGEVDALSVRMARANVDDEQTAQVLGLLITRSRDYAASLQNVGLVADVAAAFQMDLFSAADLVGKVMAGNNTIAARYLGTIKEGADVLALLRDRTQGHAETLSRSRGGIDQWNIAMGNLREALGEALITMGGAVGPLDTMTALVVRLTNIIEDNQEQFRALGNVLVWFVRIPAGLFIGIFSAIVKAIAGAVQAFRYLGEAMRWTADLFGISTKGVDEKIKRVKALEDRLYAAAAAADKFAKATLGVGSTGAPTSRRAPRATAPPPLDLPEPTDAGGAGTGEKVDPDAARAERIAILRRGQDMGSTAAESTAELRRTEEELEKILAEGNLTLERRIELEEQLREVRAALGRDAADAVGAMTTTMNEAVAGIVGGSASIGDAFGMILEQATQVDNAMELVGKDAWKSIIESIKKEAKGNALKSAAYALMETAFGFAKLATGNVPMAKKHFAAAKAFTVAAAKWGLVAGAAGLGGGGGGGADPGAERDREVGGQAADQSTRATAEIHLHLDQFDPKNPKHMRAAGEAARQWQELTGGELIYHPGS